MGCHGWGRRHWSRPSLWCRDRRACYHNKIRRRWRYMSLSLDFTIQFPDTASARWSSSNVDEMMVSDYISTWQSTIYWQFLCGVWAAAGVVKKWSGTSGSWWKLAAECRTRKGKGRSPELNENRSCREVDIECKWRRLVHCTHLSWGRITSMV